MPVLHKYSDSYHKSGYYVKVNWSAPHPYPLQTPAITEQIYLELGFEDGDKVPNALTSRLFKAGLHWTEGQGVGAQATGPDVGSMEHTDLPNLNPKQLDRLYGLIDSSSTELDNVDTGAIQDLKKELKKLRKNPASSGDGQTEEPGKISDSTVSVLSDLVGEDISRKQAEKLRDAAEFPSAFDDSVADFGRKHLITPHSFTVNDHGDPCYGFKSGSVKWTLADCRPKSLFFDWAVSISPSTDRCLELRISRTRLDCIVGDGKVSKQQAADLITVIPCLLWALNSLRTYSLSRQWSPAYVYDRMPNSRIEWLRDQVAATVQSFDSDSVSGEGFVVDIPERFFARIRTPERGVAYAPVKSLPADTKVGSEVTFDVEDRYGVNYAANIQLAEDPDLRTVVFQTEDGKERFRLPKRLPERMNEEQVVDALVILDSIGVSAAVANETVCEFLLTAYEESYAGQLLLKYLLAGTPFDPDEFPDMSRWLSEHHRLVEGLWVRPVPLAICMAVFYDSIDSETVIEDLDRQGDTTVLYQRDQEYLIVGNELLRTGLCSAFEAIPATVWEEAFTSVDDWSPPDFDLRIIAALSERQFSQSRDSPDAHVRSVIQAGVENTGLNTLYLSTG